MLVCYASASPTNWENFNAEIESCQYSAFHDPASAAKLYNLASAITSFHIQLKSSKLDRLQNLKACLLSSFGPDFASDENGHAFLKQFTAHFDSVTIATAVEELVDLYCLMNTIMSSCEVFDPLLLTIVAKLTKNPRFMHKSNNTLDPFLPNQFVLPALDDWPIIIKFISVLQSSVCGKKISGTIVSDAVRLLLHFSKSITEAFFEKINPRDLDEAEDMCQADFEKFCVLTMSDSDQICFEAQNQLLLDLSQSLKAHNYSNLSDEILELSESLPDRLNQYSDYCRLLIQIHRVNDKLRQVLAYSHSYFDQNAVDEYVKELSDCTQSMDNEYYSFMSKYYEPSPYLEAEVDRLRQECINVSDNFKQRSQVN